MKIATLNINSVNARLDNLCRWLRENKPDMMLLQEIKAEFHNFPFFELQTIGYQSKILGQKSYNGVAVLSAHKILRVQENLPNFHDENARYLECDIDLNGLITTVASIYLPNGNPPYNNLADTSKFAYKLAWMDAFLQHAENLRMADKKTILAGDFNVILTPQDVFNPELFAGNALYRPEVIERINFLSRSGYTDVYRALFAHESGYTFWDYTNASYQNDLGMRIDYIFAAPYFADRLFSCTVDRAFRGWEKASDHTILIAEFKDIV